MVVPLPPVVGIDVEANGNRYSPYITPIILLLLYYSYYIAPLILSSYIVVKCSVRALIPHTFILSTRLL